MQIVKRGNFTFTRLNYAVKNFTYSALALSVLFLPGFRLSFPLSFLLCFQFKIKKSVKNISNNPIKSVENTSNYPMKSVEFLKNSL